MLWKFERCCKRGDVWWDFVGQFGLRSGKMASELSSNSAVPVRWFRMTRRRSIQLVDWGFTFQYSKLVIHCNRRWARNRMKLRSKSKKKRSGKVDSSGVCWKGRSRSQLHTIHQHKDQVWNNRQDLE